MKRFRITSTLFLTFFALVLLFGSTASYSSHGPMGDDPHATITYWDLVAGPGASGFSGLDPHEQLADVAGTTNMLADSTPTMVTAMENGCGGFCAIMYWNPDTNSFKTVCVGGGLDFAVDVNRSSTLGTGGPPMMGTFGGGDAWSAIFGNSGQSPYVVWRGNDTTTRDYNTGTFQATGVRVNPANGRVYMGDFGNSGPIGTVPGRIVELDPATNAVRKWTIGSRPYFLAISGGFVYATAVQGSGRPDEIVRLDPATGALTRWTVPGTSNFESVVAEGNPNYISVDTDNSSRLWFTETESDQIARLDTSANTITEWTKDGIEHPNAVNNAGTQAFFTEAGFGADPGHVSILDVAESTIGVTTPAPPTTVTTTPVASMATFSDRAPFVVNEATITPSTFDSPGVDPSGIWRFPIPPGTLRPTGMTEVWRAQTISGSMEGTHHVFTFQSEAIVSCVLTLSPSSATNMVGTPHTVTATVTCDGEPRGGVVVTFTVTGMGGSTPTPPAGTCTTNAMGQCTFTYTSPTPGNDLIEASAMAPGNPEAEATKTWTIVMPPPPPPPPPPCPPEDDDDDDGHEDDDDNDGLTNSNENRLFTLLGIADSDFDGIVDGNDDSNGNGEDDEDEDDDDDCPDEDEDDDGEDDEDEDDDDNGDDDDD